MERLRFSVTHVHLNDGDYPVLYGIYPTPDEYDEPDVDLINELMEGQICLIKS